MMLKVVLLTVLALPTLVLAQPPSPKENVGRGMSQDRSKLTEELKLSDSQKDALRAFKREKGEIEKIGIDLRTEQQELRELLRDPKSNEKELYSKTDKVNELQAQMNLRKVKNLIALRKTLSPEQLARLLDAGREMRGEAGNQMRERMQERFRERRGGNGGGVGEGRPGNRRPMGQPQGGPNFQRQGEMHGAMQQEQGFGDL